MVDHLSPFESQIDAVLRRLEEIDRRLRAVEARIAASSLHVTDFPASAEPAKVERFPARRRFSPLVVASLTGRTSLVLGGGYLLRALTDSGFLPLPLGVALGLAYAIVWLAMADRAGASQKAASATFHGLAAAALAFPLLYEAVTKFKFLDAWNVAIAMTVVAALGIAVAWRRRLEGVVWIVSVAAIITALALLRAGTEIAPFALHLAFLATMTYWVAYAGRWWRVRWPSALVADGAVVWLAMHTVPPLHPIRLTLAIAAALALFGASFASFTVRMLVLGHDVIRFEVFQSAAALLVGFGGAVYIAQASNLSVTPFGVTALLLGVCAYAIAFRFLSASPTRKNFHYFSTLAIALVVAGGTMALRPPLVTVLWIALALGGVWVGGRFAYATLSAHGAAYLVAATVASGLLLEAGYGLLGPATRAWREITPVALLALAAAAACSAVSPLGVRTFRSSKVVATIAAPGAHGGVPRAIALGILVLGLTGIVVSWIVPGMAGPPGRGTDWGLVATIRTTALCMAAVLMALLARGDRVREAGWLIYPLLIAAGLKILLEDFRQSEPATLFVALVVYGTALIIGPRLASK